MKDDNIKLIQKYKYDLEIYDKHLKKQMQECGIALQQGSHIEIYDTECEIDPQLRLPVKPMSVNVSFTANQNPLNHLKLAMGNAIVTGQGRTVTDQERSVTTSDDQQQHSTEQQSKGSGEKEVTRTKLLTETKMLEEWKSPCDISSICPTTDDQVWISYRDTLSLLDREGTVIQEVIHDVGINDISLSPTTHRLWACDSEKDILELVSGQLSIRFWTREQPKSICATNTNHIIVSTATYINKYTTQGQIVFTTTVGTERMQQMLTECPITHNIAVAYCSLYFENNKDNRVVVMDSSFQKLFVYRGEIPRTYKQTTLTGRIPFRPRDIVYDSQGKIIIADSDTNRLLLLTGTGELLRILHRDNDNALAIAIDRQDVLWSVFRSHFSGYHVRILQYSSKR